MKNKQDTIEYSKPPKRDLSKVEVKPIPAEFVAEVMNFISKSYEEKDKKLEEICKHCKRK